MKTSRPPGGAGGGLRIPERGEGSGSASGRVGSHPALWLWPVRCRCGRNSKLGETDLTSF